MRRVLTLAADLGPFAAVFGAFVFGAALVIAVLIALRASDLVAEASQFPLPADDIDERAL